MERKRSVRRSVKRTYKKPFSERLKDYFRNFIAFMFSNVGIVGLVVGYTIAGAFIFIYIEGESFKERTYDVFRMRNATAARLWDLTYRLNTLNETHWKIIVSREMEMYQERIINAIRDGFDGSDTVDEARQWSFSGAFLYSLTVITTIGYGNVSPRTPEGKITTIIYAIIGMPLFLLYLSNIGDIMARSFKWTYAKCCLCRWCPSVTRRRAERRRRRLHLQQRATSPGAHSIHQPSPISTRNDWQIEGDAGLSDFDDGMNNRYNTTIRMERIQKCTPTTAMNTTGIVGDTSRNVQGRLSSGDGRTKMGRVGGMVDGVTTTAASSSVEDDNDDVTDDDDDEDDTATDITNDPQQVTVPLTICLAIMVGYVCGGAILFSKWEDWDFLDGSYFCFISLSTIGFGDIVPGDKIYNSQGIELSFIFCSMYLYLGMALIAMCFNLMQEEVIHKIRAIMKVLRYMFRCNR